MWKCKQCETICNGGTHCSVCGAKREENTAQTPQSASLQTPRNSAPTASDNASTNRLLLKITIIAVALLLAAVFALIGIMLSQDEPEPTYKDNTPEQQLNLLPQSETDSDTEEESILDETEHKEDKEKPQETPAPTPKATATPTPKSTPKPTATPAPIKKPFYTPDCIGMTKAQLEKEYGTATNGYYYEGGYGFELGQEEAWFSFGAHGENFFEVPDDAVCQYVWCGVSFLAYITEETVTVQELGSMLGVSFGAPEFDEVEEVYCVTATQNGLYYYIQCDKNGNTTKNDLAVVKVA